MKVFWSWQNDIGPNRHRHFIRSALLEAVEAVGDELGLEDADRPELDHDTKNEPGMVDIVSAILLKISKSAVFVADLTPIGSTEKGKSLPNPNVLIELGWAMQEPGWERIIVVLNTADGSTVEEMPFDIRHRRILTYNLAKGANKGSRTSEKQHLVKELTSAIKTNLAHKLEEAAAETEIGGVSAKSDDPSIWASAKDSFKHEDLMVSGGLAEAYFVNGPRGYIRIIPNDWNEDPISVSDFAAIPDKLIIHPPSNGAGSGSFGVCEEGFVRYWMTRYNELGQYEAANVACYFDETGEIWVLHGTAIAGDNTGAVLQAERLLGGWAKVMRQTFTLFDQYGASPLRRVEVGLCGVKGIKWPGRILSDSPPARKERFRLCRQKHGWDAEAQIGFLLDAYNGVRDLFGLTKSTENQIMEILKCWDPESVQQENND